MNTNTDPVRALTPEQIDAAVSAAHDPTIVHNALTRPEGYSPYCMRCPGLHRMKQVGLLHWRHSCGAEHDEAAARSALASAIGGAPVGAEAKARQLYEMIFDAIAEDGSQQAEDACIREIASALSQQPASDKFMATFRCEGNGIVGTTPAKIHAVTQHDDGCIEVVIDHWPQQP